MCNGKRWKGIKAMARKGWKLQDGNKGKDDINRNLWNVRVERMYGTA